MKIDLYSQDGTKKGTHELNSAIFETPWKPAIVHQLLRMQLDNARHPIAYTKTRGERRGGGKKPWKQKHTGRARVGSRRSPLWRKGGVTFGPTGVENYTIKMPKKQRNLALFSALAQKAREEAIIGLEAFMLDAPKTAAFATLLKKLPVKRSCLIVTAGAHPILMKSARNIPTVKIIQASYLNIADLTKFHTILCLQDAFEKIDTVWGAQAKELASSKSRMASAAKTSKATASKKKSA